MTPVSDRSQQHGILGQAAGFAVAVVGHVLDGGRKASPAEVARREAACHACPDHVAATDACSVCSCGTRPGLVALGLDLKLKRSWASSSCPKIDPAWDAEK